MRYLVLLLCCFSIFAQTTVNNFTVKTNLTVAGAPPALSVNTIAALAALNPVLDNAVVNVAGYLTVGDGGGGLFRRVSSTGLTNLAAMTVISTANANYAWQRIWDNTNVDPAWFGGFPSDGADDSTAINNALQFVWAQKQGNVKLKGGMYDLNTTLKVPYRANLIGADGWRGSGGVSSLSSGISYLGDSTTCLRMANNSNTNMLEFVSSDGPETQLNETLEDGETVTSRTQDSRVENLTFFGNGYSQSKYNCHGIVASSKWNIIIKNCSFAHVTGYALWMFDINMLRLENVFVSGVPLLNLTTKGIFFYSSSDTVMSKLEVGVVNGPSIWYNGYSSWLTLLSDSLLYNNYQSNTIHAITGWTTNTIAGFSTVPPLETGDPVEFRTTGSLPTGFSDTQLYFAVKFASNSFGFHTNRALALSGTYLAGSGSPSGSNYVTIGEASGVYMSGEARYNSLVNVRVDQNSGPGITLRNAYGNHFYGIEAYKNTGVPQNETIPDLSKSGVMFDKNAYNNNVFGTFVDQPIGFLTRSNAYNNYVNATFTGISTNFVNLSTGSNQVPVIQTLDGTISSTNAFFSSATISGSSSIGSLSSTATALSLYGNFGGQRILKLYRTNGVTQTVGIGVSVGGATIFDETGNSAVADINNSGTESRIYLGPRNSATPYTGVVASGEASGTNISGTPIRIKADQSTGNADLADAFIVMTGDAGASGSTLQAVTSKFVVEGDGDVRVLAGDVSLMTAGKGLKIKEGTNAKMGTATLSSGSAVVSTTAVLATSRIFLTGNADGGTAGWLRVSSRTNGTSFVITSSSALDSSTVAWLIVDPAP